ncbi:TPA: hypothetical protein DCG86_01355 [Candidatus Marinimicrobia bacterium]|nr:hypothetical protein [Candidatus Neomarinimicrobiota bacterium]HBY19095.1 hypothetical protein [Candidatus Neomarinimicrobiota bacterium]
MKLELQRIGLWPLFRNTFLVSGLLFLILFIFMGNVLVQMMQQSMSDIGMGGSTLSGSLSFFTLLTLAISNAFFFSLFITAAGALYNFITHWTGGINLEFNDPYEGYEDDYTENILPEEESSFPEIDEEETNRE